MNFDRLPLKRGEEPTPQKIAELERLVAQNKQAPGRGVRQRQYPWGVATNYTSQGGAGYVSPLFLPSVRRSGADFKISWQRGVIGGVEPTIKDVPISGSPANKVPVPAFEVSGEDFGPTGELLVFFQLELSPAWTITRITPVALPESPDSTPWRAFCLALILFPAGKFWRKLHMNQGYMAIQRRSSGLAHHLFWAT